MTSQPLDGWRGGYLRFHKSYVRSEPGPHMASSCDVGLILSFTPDVLLAL